MLRLRTSSSQHVIIITTKLHSGGPLHTKIEQLPQDVGVLNDNVAQEQGIRLDGGDSLLRRLAEEMAQLQHQLVLERKVREETEHTMLRMLEEMCGKVRHRICMSKYGI